MSDPTDRLDAILDRAEGNLRQANAVVTAAAAQATRQGVAIDDCLFLLDLARKQRAALEVARTLHQPVKKWEPYEGAGYSFNTREEALRAGEEEDLGVVAIEAGPQYFEVCKECGRVESDQLAETGEDWGYRESLWPCPTIQALDQ